MMTIAELLIGKEACELSMAYKKRVTADEDKRYVMKICIKQLPDRKGNVADRCLIVVYDKVAMRNVACSISSEVKFYSKYISLLDYYRKSNTIIKDEVEIENYNPKIEKNVNTNQGRTDSQII